MIARAAASVVLAGVVLLGTAGCGFVATIATQIPYNPSDGVSKTVGSIKVLNMMGFSDDGTDVNLVFTAANTSSENAVFTLQYEVDGEKLTATIPVAANSTVSYGYTEEEQLVLRDINATVGGLFSFYLQSGSDAGQIAMVPILDGSFEAYTDLLPSPAPTPTPTPTEIPEPEETPAS